MQVTIDDRSNDEAQSCVAAILPPGFFLTKQSMERIYVTRPVLLSSIKRTDELWRETFSDGVHKTRS